MCFLMCVICYNALLLCFFNNIYYCYKYSIDMYYFAICTFLIIYIIPINIQLICIILLHALF